MEDVNRMTMELLKLLVDIVHYVFTVIMTKDAKMRRLGQVTKMDKAATTRQLLSDELWGSQMNELATKTTMVGLCDR